MSHKCILLLVVAVSMVTPGSLWAANFTIDDTSPNDLVSITVNSFENGFSVNGELIQSGLDNSVTRTYPETDPIEFSGTWITIGQQPSVSGIIYLIESPYNPGLPPPLISDIFEYQITHNTDNFTATITGSFVSDTGDNLGYVPTGTDPANVYLETGDPVHLNFAYFGVNILSDVDVPEPATMTLLAMGGLAILRRRRS